MIPYMWFQFNSVQSLSRVQLFATPWIAARQASLSITNSQSSLRLWSIESGMPSSHLILCRPLLLLPPIPPSIRVFSNESTLRMMWPKYWSFCFSIIPSKEIPGLISYMWFRTSQICIQGFLNTRPFWGQGSASLMQPQQLTEAGGQEQATQSSGNPPCSLAPPLASWEIHYSAPRKTPV